MAITDLQISDTLQTGAPSIKYEGNMEPQQMASAEDPMLVEEYKKHVFDMEEQGLQPMSFEEFKAQAISGMAEGGRARYGLGSFVRKLIPNEVARVAEVAAPFVAMAAPQFALPAALAGGLGSYDRTGNLMSGLKSGAMTYGLGALSPGMERFRGVGPQSGIFTKQPFGGRFNLANVLKSRNAGALEAGAHMGDTPAGMSMNPITGEYLKPTEAKALAAKYPNKVAEYIAQNTATGGKEFIKKGSEELGLTKINEFVNENVGKIILGAMAGTGLYTAYTQGKAEIADLAEVARGEGMDIEAIRAEVQEALAGGEEAWNELKKKYPYIGEYGTKIGAAQGGRIGYDMGGDVSDRAQKYLEYIKEMKSIGVEPVSVEEFNKMLDSLRENSAQGGRIGYYAGGQSIPSEYTMEDARKTSTQDKMGGITDVMKRADLYRQGDVGQMYAAQGGRIGADEGGLMDLGGMEKDYRNDGGFVPIGGQEKADDVPARLSKNEFVFTADAVRGAGGGDIDKGAEIMENVMKNLEQGGQVSEETQGLSGAQEMFGVSERLSEVV